MSSKDKLIARLKSKPNDLKWDEVVTLCKGLDFKVIEGSGSRVKFYHEKLDFVICMHRPHHPSIVKQYAIKQLVNDLERKGLI
jgi:hypothetical protein